MLSPSSPSPSVGTMALVDLCWQGDLERVRAALGRGEGVNSVSGGGWTGLMYAVRNKHNSLVQLLLQQPGIDVNCRDRWGQTALHYSVTGDNPEGLRLLLAHPGMGSINTRDNDGDTPLMAAIRRGRLSCVIELVRVSGVDLDTRDDEGRSLEEVAR